MFQDKLAKDVSWCGGSNALVFLGRQIVSADDARRSHACYTMRQKQLGLSVRRFFSSAAKIKHLTYARGIQMRMIRRENAASSHNALVAGNYHVSL
jgi:hypothetical protein